jgi:hypothetical protein
MLTGISGYPKISVSRPMKHLLLLVYFGAILQKIPPVLNRHWSSTGTPAGKWLI